MVGCEAAMVGCTVAMVQDAKRRWHRMRSGAGRSGGGIGCEAAMIGCEAAMVGCEVPTPLRNLPSSLRILLPLRITSFLAVWRWTLSATIAMITCRTPRAGCWTSASISHLPLRSGYHSVDVRSISHLDSRQSSKLANQITTQYVTHT